MSVVRIVIVDDHPIVRHGLTGVFTGESGIDVVGEADSGPRGLAVVADTEPDVVLMDLRMRGGDGVPAIRELVRNRTHGRPRVLVLTTYDTDRDIRSALKAGADGCLLKDASRAELVRAVRDLAMGRPVLAPAALAILLGQEAENELSARELDVLRLVADGLTNKAIATRLRISESTVKTHLPPFVGETGSRRPCAGRPHLLGTRPHLIPRQGGNPVSGSADGEVHDRFRLSRSSSPAGVAVDVAAQSA